MEGANYSGLHIYVFCGQECSIPNAQKTYIYVFCGQECSIPNAMAA
jgi:hypothetical protein